jgi:hypothetical protein
MRSTISALSFDALLIMPVHSKSVPLPVMTIQRKPVLVDPVQAPAGLSR